MKTKNEDRKRKISNPKFSSAQLYIIFLSYLDIASVFTFYLPVLSIIRTASKSKYSKYIE